MTDACPQASCHSVCESRLKEVCTRVRANPFLQAGTITGAAVPTRFKGSRIRLLHSLYIIVQNTTELKTQSLARTQWANKSNII